MTIAIPEAFRVAIEADYWNSTTLLALADWLDESGESGDGYRWLVRNEKRPEPLWRGAWDWNRESAGMQPDRRNGIFLPCASLPDAVFDAVRRHDCVYRSIHLYARFSDVVTAIVVAAESLVSTGVASAPSLVGETAAEAVV